MRVTHATPGALYANTQNRDWEVDSKIPENWRSKGCIDIATQLVESDIGKKINLIFGGGKRSFVPKSEGGKRLDGKNLIDTWKQIKQSSGQNFDVLFNSDDLDAWTHTDYALGLFSNSGFNYTLERDNTQPSLERMLKQAIKSLNKNPNGFFLMLEAGLIDYSHHANLPKSAFEETLELEKAVQAALDMTDEEETLIVVTGDHSHAFTINGYPDRGNSILGKSYQLAIVNKQLPIFRLLQGMFMKKSLGHCGQ